MAVPKKKTSKARRDRRRAHHDHIDPVNYVTCSRCGAPRLPHFACPKCGFYKDRQVFEVETEAAAEEA